MSAAPPRPRWTTLGAASAAALLLGFAAGHHIGERNGERKGRKAAARDAAAAAPREAPAAPAARYTSAHYFGRHWPKNVLFGFRREELAADLALMRADGFSSVVYLVAWGDFQPVATPCCRYEDRAFERLDLLVAAAREAGLQVILRVGYGWSFHAGDASMERQLALMNDPAVRTAYLDFGRRIGERYGPDPAVQLSFLTWEDHKLFEIQPAGRSTWTRFLSTHVGLGAAQEALGARFERLEDAPFAGRNGPAPQLFHRYWDWLKRDELYLPMSRLIPRLSYEVRIDKDPQWSADGKSVEAWIDHYGTYQLPGAPVTTIYWAPFWGAENRGELLPAERALTLLDHLIRDTSERASPRQLYIDQFNFIDNTPGFRTNAIIDPVEVDDFLGKAACLFRERPVQGVGPWTWQEYLESPLHNPSFVLGLEGWTAADAGVRLIEGDPSRDARLELSAGGRIGQIIPRSRGRLPGETGEAVEACVRTTLDGPVRLRFLGPHGAAELRLAPADAGRLRCTALAGAQRADADYAFTVEAIEGRVELLSVYVHDHLQKGALRDRELAPLAHLPAYRALNAGFLAAEAPARCADWAVSPP